MPARVTPASVYLRSLHAITSNYARFARAQEVMASGKRIRFYSDAPADSARLLDLEGTVARSRHLRDALDAAITATEAQGEVLEQLSSLVATVTQKAQQAANGTLSEEDRQQLAQEIDQLLVEALGFANQEFDGRRLFAGSRVQTAPFVPTTVGGRITAVTYVGDDIVREVQLASGERKPIDVSGFEVFMDLDRGPTQIVGDVGIAAVPGAPDTVVGETALVLAHTATVFGDGAGPGGADSTSGLAPGVSTAEDTILGEHVLEVTTDEATGLPALALDGGVPVPFDGTETDLVVEGPDGAVVHVDVTALTPGFQGTVTLEASGTVAIEGGPPEPIAFTADQVLSDGNGRVLHVDTQDVTKEGDAYAVMPGTETLFDVLIRLRDDLAGDAALPDVGLTDRTLARLEALDAAHQGILRALTTVGARAASFERLSDSLDFFSVKLDEKRGEIEGADVFEASVELAEAENAYQFALAAAARLQQPTLLDYL